ncbi:MAG TPA: hypothetical protein VN918_06450 [Myxococcaceae bacterium]|nr:hypothetical protein [Myxococcaceae bacterium]
MLSKLKRLALLLEEPPAKVLRRRDVKRRGTFREKEAYGVVGSPAYAYGLLKAADLARFAGKNKTTVCEFGVATGNGLLSMVSIAEAIRAETGVEFRIVGFDAGEGLPTIDGFRDHPELWSVGDFRMTNRKELERRVDGRAELIFGDIKDTIDPFVAGLDESAPIGFISIDVDVYSGSKSALRCLLGRPELYTPAVSMYCDDVQFFFANRWCGELLAIDEFNEENEKRKIDQDRSLPGRRAEINAPWYRAMFVAHILDHEMRTRPRARSGLSLEEHFKFMRDFSVI